MNLNLTPESGRLLTVLTMLALAAVTVIACLKARPKK